MVLNAAVQMLREADELKQNILKFKSGTSMLQERSLWTTQQQLQKIYQKVLVLDLDYALEKKVEQDLWNVGFKQQIEALQAISKDRKNPLRSDGQAMLSWVLQAAAGFYLCLLHQICTTFKLDLPFRRRASLLGWVEGWGAGAAAGGGGARLPPPAAARYICQHCLVHLGDLARYRQQLRVAHTFYRHALVVSVHSGQPYNQLALVAWRRGRRLAALYWHVRSLLVRSPFPPAPANLARTLHAAASGGLSQEGSLPVLGELPPPPAAAASAASPASPASPARLDAHAYVNELIRAMHMIHSVEQLDTAEAIVNTLSASLPALVATDSFESMTLIKMSCVLIWLVHSATEDLELDGGALSEGEARAAALSHALAAAAVLALALPAAAAAAAADTKVPRRALPALKVWLQWSVHQPRALRAAAWGARAATWPALAATLNQLAREPAPAPPAPAVERTPLPEDEELHGFLPLEKALEPLCFNKHACESIGARLPAPTDHQPPSELAASVAEPELQHRVRARRLVALGRRLADVRPDHFTHAEEDGVSRFAAAGGAEQLAAALAQLAAAPAPPARPHSDSDDEPPPPPPPVIISEADFREKVREKRVGILKPQGSLERAREERAQATTHDYPDTDGGEDSSKGEDKKETRKPRVNIAMAAIMRKQEETNKQVKFVTPPPTPDSAAGITEEDDDKPKAIQSKSIKGLAALPLGRKTGGILALKDKSAGYPHLVNAEPDPPAKPDKEDKKEPKPGQSSSQNSQSYQPKRQDHPPSPNWSPNPPPNAYDGPRMNFQKNYGIQNAGIAYNPGYPSPPGAGIRLPVVNPKEIDVRTAALQKQTSRADLFQEGNKFGNYGYQMSGDKKNFLNDLPPRFANQYRHWQHDGDNKFRDDSFKSDAAFGAPQQQQQQQQAWAPPQHEAYRQPPWLRPDNQPPNFNSNFAQSVNLQPNFYSPHLAPVSNQYQSMPAFNPMPASKPEGAPGQAGYRPAVGPPPLVPPLAMAGAHTFSASLNSFGSYAPAVGYDSAMYPQFNNKLGYQPLQMKMMDKPPPQPYAGKPLVDMGSLAFNTNIIEQQRNLQMNFSDTMGSGLGAMKNLDSSGGAEGAGSDAPANTYSLFSGGAPDAAAWGTRHHQPHQSLWSGPGPSPLERLLEQQKQMKQPPAPQ